MSMDEREQQRVATPRGPRRSRVTIERGRVEEHADAGVSVRHLSRVDCGTRRDHVDLPSRGRVPQDREVVNVHAMFDDAVDPDHRNRRVIGIGSVLINRHAVAVADQPRYLRHVAKDNPILTDDHPTSLQFSEQPWTL